MTQPGSLSVVRPSTRAWVSRYLHAGERIIDAEALTGGITAEVAKLTVRMVSGAERYLVLRSYTDSARLHHAEDWLDRESNALATLSGSCVPAPALVAVDPRAGYCEFPSLLMTHLPGSTLLIDECVEVRVRMLARQLVEIHAIDANSRPREYQVLTTADTVVLPARADATVWSAAVDLIRGPTPRYEGRFLHRDFQPGNVLFDISDSGMPRITGVVDWAGASWGPTDLDVAHCSTNLALLHGPQWGSRFASAYEEAGGTLSNNSRARQYWRVRDALACSAEVQLWASPWRDAGRTDLTPSVVEERLCAYVRLLMDAPQAR